MLLIFLILSLIPFHVGLWRFFEKAGRKGWESVIPFYSLFVWCKIIKKPWYWAVAAIFPGINLIVLYAMVLHLYKAFGKYSLKDQTLGVIFYFYFVPKYSFEDIKYTDPSTLPKVPKTKTQEWVEALLFAVVAATIIKTYTFEAYKIPTSSMEETLLVGDYLFVSKVHYGPRIPNTPLTFPFVHHTLPFIPVQSFVEWIKIPYTRLPAFQSIKNNDIVVFNFPEGDTIIKDPRLESMSYYNEIRNYAYYFAMEDEALKRPAKSEQEYLKKGREEIQKKYGLGVRPVDKRENYIKRCVGIGGDVLEIVEGQVFINGKLLEQPQNLQYKYQLELREDLSSRFLYKMGITSEDQRNDFQHNGNFRTLVLTEAQAKELAANSSVVSIQKVVMPKGVRENYAIFPHDSRLNWSLDNFGPLWIPKKGETLQLTDENFAMYERAISLYEGNTLERLSADKFRINGVETNSYTFKMDYYWLMGDNRHSSLDSRFWGFVPEDHIVGKAVLVWFSKEEVPGKPFFESIRWNRVFSLINGK